MTNDDGSAANTGRTAPLHDDDENTESPGFTAITDPFERDEDTTLTASVDFAALTIARKYDDARNPVETSYTGKVTLSAALKRHTAGEGHDFYPPKHVQEADDEIPGWAKNMAETIISAVAQVMAKGGR